MFTNARGFTDDQLIRIAPSIGATHAHESRSSSYGFAPTIDVVRNLRSQGFIPTGTMQARTLDKSRRAFTKHIVIFTAERDLAAYQRRVLKELIQQVSLTNSHAGESTFRLDRMVYRLVCLNGLFVSDNELSIRLTHRKTEISQVVDATLAIAKGFDKVLGRIEAMKNVYMDKAERLEFGRAALALRYPQVVDADPGKGTQPIPTPEMIVAPRRYADKDTDVFTVFNVVQDRLVNGARYYPDFGRGFKTRAVNGIDGLTKLNKDLWALAEARV